MEEEGDADLTEGGSVVERNQGQYGDCKGEEVEQDITGIAGYFYKSAIYPVG